MANPSSWLKNSSCKRAWITTPNFRRQAVFPFLNRDVWIAITQAIHFLMISVYKGVWIAMVHLKIKFCFRLLRRVDYNDGEKIQDMAFRL